ncbi:MAG: chemotaxis protein CheA, partial [Dehalococcoidia bacterium]
YREGEAGAIEGVQPRPKSAPDAEETVTQAEQTRTVLEAAAAPSEARDPGPSEATAVATEESQIQELPATSGAGAKAASSSQTVRIDVERLDSLMNLIGELVIDRTRIAEITQSLESSHREDPDVESLGKTTSHIVKVVDQLQEDIMKVRMLPIGTVFNAFPRMMRDLARKMDKRVNFVVDGRDTEIDRTVIERIRDPLVHLLRNSIDHGVEPAEERLRAGKPETATIRLNAYQEQGHIVITVEDDGAGIDRERLRDAAVSKGFISADAAARLTEAEALDLIFLAGNSTVKDTTEISGRGVGMDIVKTNIEAINGFVSIETQMGIGTTFSLRLPITLATLKALLVTLDQCLYAVPLIYVLETVKVQRSNISTVRGNEMLRLREKIIPLLRLRRIFGLDGVDQPISDAANVVVIKTGEHVVGLVVDSLVTQQDITVKSLGSYVGGVKGIAGASILGDGRVLLIVDVPSMMHLATRHTGASEARVAA